jgi:hypothetical protein
VLGAIDRRKGDVWVDDRCSVRLLRLDRATGRVVARIPVVGRLPGDRRHRPQAPLCAQRNGFG